MSTSIKIIADTHYDNIIMSSKRGDV